MDQADAHTALSYAKPAEEGEEGPLALQEATRQDPLPRGVGPPPRYTPKPKAGMPRSMAALASVEPGSHWGLSPTSAKALSAA